MVGGFLNNEHPGLIPLVTARASPDATLRAFAEGLTDPQLQIADLRPRALGSGFSPKGGVSSGDPPMGDALIAALAPKINAEGGCNAGFLRDDALLVVVFINDTEDINSTSWPHQQYKAVVDAKGGDQNAIIVLGVIGQPIQQGAQEVPGCTYDGNNYDPLRSAPFSVTSGGHERAALRVEDDVAAVLELQPAAWGLPREPEQRARLELVERGLDAILRTRVVAAITCALDLRLRR